MTDGILLAEIQRDRMLRRYDTLIVDEAHERSLNIDFILGYLRQLLPAATRPEGGRHVGDDRHGALRQPLRRRRRRRSGDRGHRSDVPGRGPLPRRSATTAIRCRRSSTPSTSWSARVPATCSCSSRASARSTTPPTPCAASSVPAPEVLPLYARLSSAEQHRIFQPHRGRRVVLSTNVAETSLTVPGVRYVVDAGTARISRYSRRLKVQRLPIEPVSQASAEPARRPVRPGRAGHLHPPVQRGRLRRPAGVHRTRDPAHQPGVGHPADDGDRPRRRRRLPVRRATGRRRRSATATCCSRSWRRSAPPTTRGVRPLTPIGKRLARLPIDPRLGRMVLEADRHGCVREVLVIAAALSIQDPRERPHGRARRRPTQLHRRFDVAGSDLLSIVALWDYLRAEQRARSSNQFRKLCRAEYLNYLRVREWQDLYSQLRRVAGDLGVPARARTTRRPSRPRPPGGARRAAVAPRVPRPRPPRVPRRARRDVRHRSRLGARQAAAALGDGGRAGRDESPVGAARRRDPAGVGRARRQPTSSSGPTASRGGTDAAGRAIATETVTLYGLPIVTGRTIGYDRVDRAAARELFIRHALVARRVGRRASRSSSATASSSPRSARSRRGSVAATCSTTTRCTTSTTDRVPADVVSTRHFDRWWRDASAPTPDAARAHRRRAARRRRCGHPSRRLSRHVAQRRARPPAVATASRPASRSTASRCGSRSRRSTRSTTTASTGRSPAIAASSSRPSCARCPRTIRRALIPLAETVAAAAERLGAPRGRLVDALAGVAHRRQRRAGRRRRLRPDGAADHLRDARARGRRARARSATPTPTSAAIRARLATAAREAIAAAVPLAERTRHHDAGTSARCRRIVDDRRRRPSGASATRRCSTTTTACRCAS